MIIQHYEFSVRRRGAVVFDGETYFGFFHPDALAEQAGIREAAPYELTRRKGRTPGHSRSPIAPRFPTAAGGWSTGSMPWSRTGARTAWA